MSAHVTAGFCLITIFQCAAMTFGQIFIWAIQKGYEEHEKKKKEKKEKATREEGSKGVREMASQPQRAAEEAPIEARYNDLVSQSTPPSVQFQFQQPVWDGRQKGNDPLESPFGRIPMFPPLVPAQFAPTLWDRRQNGHDPLISTFNNASETPLVWNRTQRRHSSAVSPLSGSPEAPSPVPPQQPRQYNAPLQHFQPYGAPWYHIPPQYFPPQDYTQHYLPLQNYTYNPLIPQHHASLTSTTRSSIFSNNPGLPLNSCNATPRTSFASLATVEELLEDPEAELKPLDSKEICKHCMHCRRERIWQQLLKEQGDQGQPRMELSPLAARFPRDEYPRPRPQVLLSR